MSALAPRALPDLLLSRGQRTFSLGEAKALLGTSEPAVRQGLARLAQAGRIFSPSRGLYVVIPPEYRSWGTVPASHFIDDLMRVLGRVYYVALLSATEMHGAAHQAPQVFQVMCDRHVADRDFGRTRLRFYTGRHVRHTGVERRNVPTGHVRLSPPELTAVDLVEHPDESGGISNVATVLAELGRLEGQALADYARARTRSVARRLGWLLELVETEADLAALRDVAAPQEGHPTPLRVGAPRHGVVDRAWNVRIKSSVEPDL